MSNVFWLYDFSRPFDKVQRTEGVDTYHADDYEGAVSSAQLDILGTWGALREDRSDLSPLAGVSPLIFDDNHSQMNRSDSLVYNTNHEVTPPSKTEHLAKYCAMATRTVLNRSRASFSPFPRITRINTAR